MQRLIVFLCLFAGFWPARALADLPEAVWGPLKERQVWIETKDHTEVTGKLTSIEGDAVTLLTASGEVVIVKKAEVRSLRGPDDLPPPRAGRAAPAEPRAPLVIEGQEDRSSFAGVVVQPVMCVSKCDGSLMTFGGEVGSRFIGLAFRYGYAEGNHALLPDLRFFYDIRVHKKVWVTPLVDVTPGFTIIVPPVGDAITLFALILRPGVRVGFALSPSTSLFVEPLALEATLYSRVISGGEGSSTDVVLRYNLGFGIQYRH